MYVKLMGPEDCPDSDTRKTFRLIQQVVDVRFERHDDGKCFASFRSEDSEYFTEPAPGNVYVLNDQGKTVASFGPAQYVLPNAPRPGGAFLLFVIDGGRIQWQASYATRDEAVAELNGLRPDGTSSLHEDHDAAPATNDAPLSGEGIEFAFIVESPHFVAFV